MNKAINPTYFEKIPALPEDAAGKYVVHAIIETPRNIRNKYALDPEFGIFMLKTIIPEGLQWPYDYGFVPQTLGQDGDPLDVVFLSDEATFCGCFVRCRLLGIVRLEKNGEENDRLLACPECVKGVAQTTDGYKDVADLPRQLKDSLIRFLIEYSAEQDNEITFKGLGSRKRALQAIKDGMQEYKKKHKKN